jgi:hypothetical protein
MILNNLIFLMKHKYKYNDPKFKFTLKTKYEFIKTDLHLQL